MNQTESELIEELRIQMLRTASDKALSDERVLKVSKKLDELIYQFYKNQPCVKS